MSTSDERLKILNMIQEGKITPQVGLTLLEQLAKVDEAKVELKESLKDSKGGIKVSIQKDGEDHKISIEKDPDTKNSFQAEIRASIDEAKSSAHQAVQEAHEYADKLRQGKIRMEEMNKSFTESSVRGARYFHLQVTDTHTGKSRVDVRMPVGVITAGVKLGSHFSPEIHGMDTNHLLEMISEGDTGKVMDVTDEDDCEHVVVTLE